MVGGNGICPACLQSFSLLTSGILMNYTGITQECCNCAMIITNRLPGSLAQVNIVLSTLMGGLSGSNIADAAMQSKIVVPEMGKKGLRPCIFNGINGSNGSLITESTSINRINYVWICWKCFNRGLFLRGILPGIAISNFFYDFIRALLCEKSIIGNRQ